MYWKRLATDRGPGEAAERAVRGRGGAAARRRTLQLFPANQLQQNASRRCTYAPVPGSRWFFFILRVRVCGWSVFLWFFVVLIMSSDVKQEDKVSQQKFQHYEEDILTYLR